MKLSNVVSGLTLAVSVGAFGLTGALSLRAGVQPLYAVIRGIAAFIAVIWLARTAASALDVLGPVPEEDDPLGLVRDREEKEQAERGSSLSAGRR